MSKRQKIKKRKRSKKHGFLVRQKRAGGRAAITRRRRIGRKRLSA